jgi:hypothetical protein
MDFTLEYFLSDKGIRMDIINHLPYLATVAATKALILELGTQYGNGSTKALYEGLQQSIISPKLMISVDIRNQMTESRIPTENWKSIFGTPDPESEIPEELQQIVGNSTFEGTFTAAIDLIHDVWPGAKAFDVVFIDSFHNTQHIINEINLWRQNTDDDTIWIIHDVWVNDLETDVSLAVAAWASENSYSYFIQSKEAQGLAVMTKLV